MKQHYSAGCRQYAEDVRISVGTVAGPANNDIFHYNVCNIVYTHVYAIFVGVLALYIILPVVL